MRRLGIVDADRMHRTGERTPAAARAGLAINSRRQTLSVAPACVNGPLLAMLLAHPTGLAGGLDAAGINGGFEGPRHAARFGIEAIDGADRGTRAAQRACRLAEIDEWIAILIFGEHARRARFKTCPATRTVVDELGFRTAPRRPMHGGPTGCDARTSAKLSEVWQ